MDRGDAARPGMSIAAGCRAACFAVASLAVAVPAAAQGTNTGTDASTRAAAIAAKQAEKARSLKPRVPHRAERIVKWVQDEFIDEPSGFYPVFGSVYSGGGFALGAGYRRYYGDNTHWDAKVLQSIRNYRLIEVSTSSWNHAGGRLDLRARAGWRDAPGVAYYGMGIDSPEDPTGFGLSQRFAGGDVAFRPASRTHVRAGLLYEDYSLGDRSGARPAIGSVHTAATAPSLGTNPSYVHFTGAAGYDWRPSPGYARSGGLYEIRYHHYAAANGGADSFNRLEGEVVQHLPLVRENYVLSFRGQAETTLNDAMVPFYLLSSLGGSDTLRGYPSWRFRDRHAALSTVELRWIPNRNSVDVALFYDAGMVAPRWDDIAVKRFKSDVGIGVRFHSLLATPLRIEVAKGREGMRLVLAGSAAF
jgi:outer membrane protein assembly factor BamA